MPSVDALRVLLEPYLEDSSLRRALGPPVANAGSSRGPQKTFTPPTSALAHSTFPKMLERALHMRLVVALSALALFAALATIAFKLGTSGAPTAARVPAKAPAVALPAASAAPTKAAPQTSDALSLLPVRDAAPARPEAPTAAALPAASSPALVQPQPASTAKATVQRPLGAARVAPARTAPAKSKIKLGEFGLAAEAGRRKRVETPRLDEF
jgi:hypothetical protein